MNLWHFAFERHLFTFKNRRLLLIAIWTFSITCGILLAARFEHVSASLMRTSLFCEFSLIQFLFSLLVPLVGLTLCVYLDFLLPICLACCIEGVSLGYCMYGLLLSFHSAGWLISLILMFPWLFMQVGFFCCYFHFLNGRRSSVLAAFFLCIALSIVALCLYNFILLPFINDLLFLLKEEGIVYSCWI